MKVIVLDYNTGKVHIHTAPKKYTYSGDVENWFLKKYKYKIEEIHWMICKELSIKIN